MRTADERLAADVAVPLEQRLLTTLARPRLYAMLLGAFAAFALVIAAVGLFGLLSYSVSLRSRELAMRAALGARRVDIVRLVLRQGLSVMIAGIGAGLLASAWLTRVLSTQLYGVTPARHRDVYLVPLLLFAAGALACLMPARRASNLDPQRVLRGARAWFRVQGSGSECIAPHRSIGEVTASWARTSREDSRSVDGRSRAIRDSAGREALVDFGECRLNLLLPHRMRRRRRLALELGTGQPQRFDCPRPLGVRRRLRVCAAAPFGFPLFHLLLDSRVCVDQAFSRVTHSLKC